MPMIYRRFTEKAAEEWRQIYKALQLLEFLIKHGSERVIDDARGHIALLKMLRQFHYIDQNGKDQGINVRNRAKELAELLGDVERIRSERKKARATKNKYTGVEGGAFSGGGGFSGGDSSRYGGFGSESTEFGGFSGGVYGDGGGFGGQQSDWQESGGGGSRSDRFEEYDEFDEGAAPARTTRRAERSERVGTKKTTPAAAPPKKKEPEVDLFSFDDPAQSSAPPAASNNSSFGGFSGGAPAANDDDEDEFDDFQSATPAAQPTQSINPPPITSSASTTAQFAAPTPVSAPQPGISQMVNMTSPSGTPGPNYSSFSQPPPQPAQPAQKTSFQSSGPNYFGGVQAQQAPSGGMSGSSAFSGMSSMGGGFSSSSSTPTTMANAKPVPSSQPKPAGSGGDAFGALWGKASTGIKKTSTTTSGPAMGTLAKEKSSAGIWGAPAPTTPMGGASQSGGGSASDDLLG